MHSIDDAALTIHLVLIPYTYSSSMIDSEHFIQSLRTGLLWLLMGLFLSATFFATKAHAEAPQSEPAPTYITNGC